MADEVLTEVRGRVLLVTLNRPDAMNAINTSLAQGLLAAVDRLDGDDALSVGVLTGAGRGFSAGMDLKAFATEGPPEGFEGFIRDGARKPMIAAIEGFALAGGLELAMTCDLLVAAEGIRIGIPEVGVGLFAAGGALIRLPTRMPYGVAMKLALTGDPITSDEAYRYGLISELAETGGAVAAAMAIAQRIAENAPLAVAASKQIVRSVPGLTEAEAWAMQAPHAAAVFTSNDATEGATAFTEKRAPTWRGT